MSAQTKRLHEIYADGQNREAAAMLVVAEEIANLNKTIITLFASDKKKKPISSLNQELKPLYVQKVIRRTG